MTSQDLRFKAVLNAFTKTLTISDTNTYTGQYQSVLIKVTQVETGVVMYENSGFASSDYSHPDIVPSISTDFEIGLTLDIDGNIICGDYLVEYKVNETLTVTTDSVTSTVVAGSLKTLILNFGSIATADADAQLIIDSGVVENQTSGSVNFGLIKILISSYNSTTNVLTITTDDNLEVEAAVTIDLSVPETIDYYSTTNTFKYCYVKPTSGIELTSSCSQSTLTSEDTTNYVTTNAATSYTPTTLTRVHTIEAPLGSTYTVPAPSSSAKVILLPNIWTGEWQTTITTEVEYSVKKWSNSVSTYWFFIADTIEGYKHVEVQCKTCFCELYDCTVKLYKDWITSLGNSPENEKWLRESVLRLTSLWMQYQQAVACGKNPDIICDEMALILTSHNCKCTLVVNDVSKEIIPVSEVFGAGNGSKIYFTTAEPNPSFGNDSDTVINSTNMDVYYKESGNWNLKGTMKCTKGDEGEAGATWTSGTGIPSNGSGNNGDFYLRTATYDVYKKTAGVWEINLNIKGDTGDSGDAATIEVGTVSKTYDNSNPIVVNSGSTSAAVLDFTLPSNKMTKDEFSRRVQMPILKTQNRSTKDVYALGNAIYITAIDTVNKIMTLNYIPNEIKSVPYNEGGGNYYEWTIWSYKTSSNNHNYYRRADIVDIDFATKQVTYGTTHYEGGDSTWDFAVNMNVMFVNPFANKSFTRKNFLIYKTQEVTHPVNGTKKAYTSFPLGMTKKDGVYRFWTINNEFTRWRPSYLGASKVNYFLTVYEGANESIPTNLSPSLVLDYSDFETALGTAIQPASANNATPTFIRNVDDETLEFFFESKQATNASDNLIYIFEVTHDGVFQNIRSYPVSPITTYYTGSYITGCVYINNEYVFDYLDFVTGGAANWKMREFKLVGDSVFGQVVMYTGRDVQYEMPVDITDHPGKSFSLGFRHCNYKGLDLFAFQMRNEGNYNHMGSIVNGLAYYDYSDNKIKDVSSNNIWHFATEIEAQTASTADTHGVPVKIYDTDLGYDHLGMPCMFYDKEEDILFFMGAETNGSNDYAPFVSRVRFKNIP